MSSSIARQEGATPRVLVPFDRREVLTLEQAAGIAGKTSETLRRWCAVNDLGRRVGSRWAVSHPALLMWLDGDRSALRAYHAGDRASAQVQSYFVRARCAARRKQLSLFG